MSREKEVEKAKERLRLFLDNHSHLKPYQEKIIELLDKVGDDPVKRFQTLIILIGAKQQELKEKLSELESLLKNES